MICCLEVSAGKKSIFRLAIIILAIPVAMLLVLHFFGRNEMKVEIMRPISCVGVDEVRVVLNNPVKEKEAQNQLNRVIRSLAKRRTRFDTLRDTCLGDTIAFHLIDRSNMLRGSYEVNQKDVNRLFIELDIIRQHDAYGREVSR